MQCDGENSSYGSLREHDSARPPPLTVYAGREALSPQEIVHVDHVYGSLLQYAFSCAPWSLTLTDFWMATFDRADACVFGATTLPSVLHGPFAHLADSLGRLTAAQHASARRGQDRPTVLGWVSGFAMGAILYCGFEMSRCVDREKERS